MMKTLMQILVAVLVIFSMQAQDRNQDRDHDKTQDRDQLKLQDYLLCESGTMLQIKDQDRVQLKDPVRLLDGTLVYTDGTYLNDKGVLLRLQSGECLDMDGNKFANQAQFQKHLQVRIQAMNQLHYLYQNGNLYQVQNQQRTQIRERVKLTDMVNVDPDGSYQLMNQQRIMLNEGECLDPDGNRFNNQAQFRKQAQLGIQALAQEHYMFKNGNMYRVQNQQETQIRESQSLQNGLAIHPDGSYQLRNHDQIQLRNGECIDPEGNIYGSVQQFQQQEQIRLLAMNQEHYMYQNGKMYRVQDQEMIQLRQRVQLQNGTEVNPDGTYQLQNQVQARLGEGECIDLNGNQYRNQTQMHQQTQTRFMAMAEPHFNYENGKLYQTQNQVQVQLTERWRLKNGASIFPDGTYQLKNGKREQLRNGEYIDGDGKRYENQDRFRERMELRIRDRIQIRDQQRMDRRMIMEPRKKIGDR